MTATSIEKVNGHAPGFDAVALAKAEAIRTEAAAKAEALRVEAEGRAEAERIKAAEESRKQKIANDKAEARAREEQEARETRIAKLKRQREDEERAAREADKQAAAEEQAEAAKAAEVAAAEEQWRQYALRFYAVCSVVALPVQVAAFYNPNALWLMAAPIMLEGGAWVVLKGAKAAAADRRPHWHYRLIAWVLAFIAAGINLWHGLNAFDPATAIGTAFASIAGPGVWDLHEHGRIRTRDGKPSWRERRAQEKAAKEEAKRRAAEEKKRATEKEATGNAAKQKAAQLTELRKTHFAKVWAHAEKLAADLGEVDPNAVWERAKLDVEGAKPGESADVLRMRNAATARVEAARQNKSVNTLSKNTNAQRAIQTPRSTYRPIPPVRKPRDTPRYTPAAGRAHGDLLRRKQATKNTRPNDN